MKKYIIAIITLGLFLGGGAVGQAAAMPVHGFESSNASFAGLSPRQPIARSQVAFQSHKKKIIRKTVIKKFIRNFKHNPVLKKKLRKKLRFLKYVWRKKHS